MTTGINLKKIFYSISLIIIFVSPGIAAEQKKQSGSAESADDYSGELPEVVIKGGQRAKIASEKPPLAIPLDMDEPLQPVKEVEQDILKRQPEALRNPSAGFASTLYNKNLVLPARIRLAKDPVKVFYPLRDILSLSPAQFQEVGTGWEMIVTDPEGHAFTKFSGRGLPPANVPWNGRNNKSEIVEPGKKYSLVINYNDTRNQQRTYVGEPFSFDGIVHQEPEGLMISLALSALFETKKDTDIESIKESGMDILRECADWIKRFYFNYPVQVECGSKTIGIANARAQAAAKALRTFLLLPRGEIPISGFASDTPDEWLDIIVANR